MANEIQIVSSMKCTNGSHIVPKIGGTAINIDQTAQGGGVPGVVSIGTAEEDISFGDISTLGWLWMKNLDVTNYVTWGPKSGTSMVAVGRMEAGEPASFRLEPGITLRMAANTAACKVQILALED